MSAANFISVIYAIKSAPRVLRSFYDLPTNFRMVSL
jgi:hypothetical protein